MIDKRKGKWGEKGCDGITDFGASVCSANCYRD